MSEEMYKFTQANVTIRDRDLYMRFCGKWFVMDLEVTNAKILKDGDNLRYMDRDGVTKSLSWDIDNKAIRVREYEHVKHKREYLLTYETVVDFSDYVCDTYRNIKDTVNDLDNGLEDIEPMLSDALYLLRGRS
jgi:hypothetical protein|nr:MAG TPA: hypothetical protein [Caudoviricetes sp.]